MSDTSDQNVPSTEPSNSAVPEVPAAPLPPENILRGTLLALIVLPVGMLVYLGIWQLGFISAIAGFLVAFGAFFLYRLGSGGRISIPGALIITGITVVTLVLAFLWATASQYVENAPASFGSSWWEIMLNPGFIGAAVSNEIQYYFGDFAWNGGLTLVFGLLGCFAVLRNVFFQARQPAAADPTQPAPPAPPAPPAA